MKLLARIPGMLFALALTLMFACALVRPALAQTLHGVVVSSLPEPGHVVIRHEAYGDMPAMTMVFTVRPAAEATRLHPGDQIIATVTQTGNDEVLNDVRVVGGGSLSQRVVRDVHPLAVGDGIPTTTTFFDQRAQGFSFQDFRGQTVVLSFIYTRCKDPRMCPLVSANFHLLQKKLADLPVHLVEITLDPAFDTPTVLADYGQRFDADPTRWTLGTGPTQVVNDFAASFGIAVFPDQAVGLIHSERTAIIDRNGKIVDLIDQAAFNPDDVVAEVRSLSGVPTNPIAWLDYELSKASAALCGNTTAGYSGLLDLAIVIAIFAGACWILYRFARKIWVEEG